MLEIRSLAVRSSSENSSGTEACSSVAVGIDDLVAVLVVAGGVGVEVSRRVEVDVGLADRRLAEDAGHRADRDAAVPVDLHVDPDAAVDQAHRRHLAVVDAEVGDLGVGVDAAGGVGVDDHVVGPVDLVDRHDVADRPHREDRRTPARTRPGCIEDPTLCCSRTASLAPRRRLQGARISQP